MLQGGVGGVASAALAAVVAANKCASGQGMGARNEMGHVTFCGHSPCDRHSLAQLPPSALYKASSLAGNSWQRPSTSCSSLISCTTCRIDEARDADRHRQRDEAETDTETERETQTETGGEGSGREGGQ